jgi:hypothetical protein
MKYQDFMSLNLLVALGMIGVSAEPQYRPHSHPQVAKTSGTQEIDSGSHAERDKIIAECEIPDRPKPATEAEIKLVSQLCGIAAQFVGTGAKTFNLHTPASSYSISGWVSCNLMP